MKIANTGTVMAILAAAVLISTPTSASPATERCSAPQVFGSYALRACVEPAPGHAARAFAYVSLERGHSPCKVRGRMLTAAGTDVSGLHTTYCPPPDRAVRHWKVPIEPTFCGANGFFYSAFSIERLTDYNIAPTAQSPTIRAACF
jgi:hypothetical protein